jgi:hypothetical protein
METIKNLIQEQSETIKNRKSGKHVNERKNRAPKKEVRGILKNSATNLQYKNKISHFQKKKHKEKESEEDDGIVLNAFDEEVCLNYF